MKRYTPQSQMRIIDFDMPFASELDPENRWVVMSGVIPWDTFAKAYYKNFKTNHGAPTKDSRLVLGVILIKHLLKLDDVGVIEMIQENPYLQYFIGLKTFTREPVMDPSLLVHIRKRIDLKIFELMADEFIRNSTVMTKSKKVTRKEQKTEDRNDDDGQPKNKGKLQLDATVADAEIKYPTDLDLLNDSREKSEELIDHICETINIKVKPRTYRRKARAEYLNVSRKKRKTEKELRRALRMQMNYCKRNINTIDKLLNQASGENILNVFDKHQQKYYFVIQQIVSQQVQMFKEGTHSVEDRIVSIHQPHVRPVVRGKAKAKVEFGAKINASLINGYTRIDHCDWNAYNEGVDLKMQVERYRELYGYYPEVVLVDKIYLNRDNRHWLKERGIAHTGDPLGRKPVINTPTAYQKRRKRQQCAERNQIEGKFGQAKRGYNLNNIRARLSSTSMSWIGAIIFVMNILRHIKDFPSHFFDWGFNKFMSVKQIINAIIPYPVNLSADFGIIQ